MPEPIIEHVIFGPYHFRNDMGEILQEYKAGILSLDEAVARLQEIVETHRRTDCHQCSAPGEPFVLCLDCLAKERECEMCKAEACYCSVECARDNEENTRP